MGDIPGRSNTVRQKRPGIARLDWWHRPTKHTAVRTNLTPVA